MFIFYRQLRMTKFIFSAITAVFLVGCSTMEGAAQRAAGNGSGQQRLVPRAALRGSAQGDALQRPLFLHLLAPGTNAGAGARRIASTRIYLSQDFSVSVGDADNPFTNRWDGAVTTPRIDRNGVAERRPLEPMWDSGDAVLAGRIDLREGQLFAQLQGRNQTTLSYFRGEIELEKPVEEHGAWYRGGAIWGVWFVLSESPDCGEFLVQLDNGTLRSPSVVERNSLEAKRWLELNSGDSSGSAKDKPSAER
jgi:hypothetical protein